MRKILLLLTLITISFSSLFSQEEKSGPKTAFVIPIHGEIDKALMVFIRRSVEEAKRKKPDYIIFDIDTFGGRVDSALQITTIIGSIKESRTIAFVTSGAESTGVSWSAGALIAFSCSAIYMSAGTSMGAAAPVYQTQEGMTMAPEKTVSAVRAQMASLAEKNSYNPAIAKAMVDMDIVLIEIFINDNLYLISEDDLPDYEREAKKEGKKIERGKTLSKKGKLLALTAKELEKYGISSGTVSGIDELYKGFQLERGRITNLERTTTDQLVAFLTGSIFVSLLVMIGLAALYMEITSPGFGIPGTVGIICFAIVFGGNALLGRVGSFELLLFIAGLILLIIEIFIIPGFGVTGITGIICMALALTFSLQDFIIPQFDWQWDIFGRNVLTIGISLLCSFVILFIFVQLFPRTSAFKRLTLNTTFAPEEGYVVESAEQRESLEGKRGVTVTILRPAGKAMIEDELYEVESDGDFVERDSEIEVVEVTGNRIIVRRCING